MTRECITALGNALFELEGDGMQDVTDTCAAEWIDKGLEVRRYGQKYLWLVNRNENRLEVRDMTRKLEKSLKVKIVRRLRNSEVTRMLSGSAPEKEPEGVVLDKKCKWALYGEGGVKVTFERGGKVIEGNGFKKESACERAMVKKRKSMFKRLVKWIGKEAQCLTERGLMRVAQDIPGGGANKRYFYAICEANHRRGCVCEGHLEALNVKEDKHFYEIIRDGLRRHYFDIEWVAEERDQDEVKLKLVLKLFDEFAGLRTDSPKYVTEGSRWKNNGEYKHSYHVIYRDLIFKGVKDHAEFMKQFRNFVAERPEADDIAEISDYKLVTRRCYNFAWDGAVYTSNRLFRLPGQCKPNMYVPFETRLDLPGCIEDPITSTVFTGKPIKVAIKEKSSGSNPLEGLAAMHKKHYQEVLLPMRINLSREKIPKEEVEDNMELPLLTRWDDLSSKELRKSAGGYHAYMQFLGAVIDIIQPPKEDVLAWMNHSNPDKAWAVYEYVYNRQKSAQWQRKHWTILEKYGLLGDPRERVDKLMKMVFEDAQEYMPPILPVKEGFGKMPVFETVKDVNIDDPSIVSVMSGAMGVGKTRSMINKLTRMKKASKVLYIVGRKKLAWEIHDKISELEGPICATRSPHVPRSDRYALVQIAIINSVCKFRDDEDFPDLVVLDEVETTLQNLVMKGVDEGSVCCFINSAIANAQTKTILMDAMFTLPSVLFVESILKFMVMENKSISYQELTRDGHEQRPRDIIPLWIDSKEMRLYHERLEREDSVHIGNNGFLMRLLYETTIKGNRVAVAVPTKGWASLVQSVLPDSVRVKRVDSSARENGTYDSEEGIFDNLRKVDVLIYTSVISAGHSIDIKNHFDSVFLVVNGTTKNGEWRTPPIGEMIQMSARVRYPISDKIFVTVDTINFSRDYSAPKGRYDSLMFGKNVPLTLFQSGKELTGKLLSRLSRREFLAVVVEWLRTKAYPDSDVNEEVLSDECVRGIMVSHLGKLNANIDQFDLNNFWHTHDDAETFIELNVDSRGKTIFIRKRLAEEDFDHYPDLKKIKVGADEYVVKV